MSTTDRARLISRLQELYDAFLAYAQTLPDYYDADSDEPTLWADIRRPTRLFIQLDDDILCSANSDVSDWSTRNLAMYAKQLEVAAIGLGIIPPKAAEIMWEVGANGCVNSDCLEYYCKEYRDGKWLAVFPDTSKRICETLDEAKAACQSHKQRRLNELL